MTGHNWGSEHAERWVWLHAVGFAEAPGVWLDVAIGRVRIGRAVTPWVANGALALDGRRYALGGLGRVRSTFVDARPGALAAVIGGKGAVMRADVSAPEGQTVAFVYADPGGGEHHTLNCSIAAGAPAGHAPGSPRPRAGDGVRGRVRARHAGARPWRSRGAVPRSVTNSGL